MFLAPIALTVLSIVASSGIRFHRSASTFASAIRLAALYCVTVAIGSPGDGDGLPPR